MARSKNDSKTLIHFASKDENQPQKNIGQSNEATPTTSFGAVLQKYRMQNEVSQPELASMLGTSRNTITNWENDKSRPDIGSIRQLVTMFGIPLYELFGLPTVELPSSRESALLDSFRKLSPVSQKVVERMVFSMYEEETNARHEMLRRDFCIMPLSATAAAAGVGCEEVDLPVEACFIKQNRLTARADTLIRVSGRSMEPKYHDGDLVYVLFTNDINDGDDVICYYNEGAVIKRYHNHKLLSLNPAYPFKDKYEDDNVRVVGRVLGIVEDEDIPDADDNTLLHEIMSYELREFEAEHGIE